MPSGKERIRFKPVPAWQTPEAMESLVWHYNEAAEERIVHELILIAAFVLDFLVTHPFLDGNGRLSRLLTLLLLYQSGYKVVRYVSLEKIIWDSSEQYYDALYRSSLRWHEGEHDIRPWLGYFLSVVLVAHQCFYDRNMHGPI